MSKITIPPAALEAGARTLARGIETEDYWPYYKDDARAAFLAMIEVWEGMIQMHHPREQQHALILPLPPQENSDDDGQPDEVQEWNDYDPDC